MFEFLSKLQFWQILTLFIIFFGTVIFIIMKGKIKFLSKDRGISINENDKDLSLLRHKGCPLVYDVIGVINKTAEISTKISNVKNSILSDQTKYSEQKLLIILDTFKQTIIEGLISSGEENPTQADGYSDYVLLLELLYFKLSTFFRSSFVDNNFDRFKNEDGSIDAIRFNKYSEEKVDAIESIINDLFNKCYKSIATINREKLRKINDAVSGKFNQMFVEIFQYALETYLNGVRKMATLDFELKHYISKVIGIDPSDEKVDGHG